MTLDDVKKRLDEIQEKSGNDELAHYLEDSLREDFIKYISDSGIYPYSEIAAKVLTSSQIDFGRLHG